MKLKHRIVLFLFTIICGNSTVCYTQQYFFRNYSVNEGLPQASVYCMIQDSRGYIWLGTDGGGVCKFDGKNFQTYNKNDGITGNVVRSLFEDSNENIWIGTDQGITLYDGYNFTKIDQSNGLVGTYFLSINEGKKGQIWASTNDEGIYKIEHKDSIVVTNYSQSDGLVNNFIFDSYYDTKGRIWLAMIGGINILTFDNSEFDIVKLIEGDDIPSGFITCIEADKNKNLIVGTVDKGYFNISNTSDLDSLTVNYPEVPSDDGPTTIWDIHCDNNGHIWLGTENKGLAKISEDNNLTFYTKENGLATNQVLNILEDNEGNIWLSSMGSGISMFQDEKFINYGIKEGIPSNQILSLLIENNEYYAGTDYGLAYFKMSGSEVEIEKVYTVDDGLIDNTVNSLAIDKEKNIWIGTSKGLNILKNGTILSSKLNYYLPSDIIKTIFIDSKDNKWIGTSGGYANIIGDNVYTLSQSEGLIHDEVQSIIEDKLGRIWMGTLGGLVKRDGEIYTDYNEEEGLNDLEIHCLAEDKDGNIWIGTKGGGVYTFDINKDTIFLTAGKENLTSLYVYSLLFTSDTSLIVSTDKGFNLLYPDNKFNIVKSVSYDLSDGFMGGSSNLNSVSKDAKGNIWFGTINGITKYNAELDRSSLGITPNIYVTDLRLSFKNIDWGKRIGKLIKWFNLPDQLKLSYRDNHLTFVYSGINYQNSDKLEYSYFLKGQSKNWSPFTTSEDIVFQGLPHGQYEFRVAVRNKYGVQTISDGLAFVIKPPFYKTIWFLSIASVTLILSIVFYMRYRLEKLKKDKIKLEKIIRERTKEIVEQKNEIEKQRDIVTLQKKEITDSINYAKNIQRAVLPKEGILDEVFSDHFILFKPKDIVSGDFYWISKKNKYLVFTAADCTGHGVPGAFMSMLGVSFLNKIVNEHGITQPDLILNDLRESIVDSLQQKGVAEGNKDGMDMAICSVDIEKRKLYFAGANNPMYILRNVGGEYALEEIKGDRMPVAIYNKMDDFICHEVDLNKGDTFYLFSDGYVDQFGGPKERKFMKKNFKELLVLNQNKNMEEQGTIYNKVIEDWMNYDGPDNNSSKQIDDIIVLGVRV